MRRRVSHQPNSIQGSGSETISSDSICSCIGNAFKVSSTDSLTAHCPRAGTAISPYLSTAHGYGAVCLQIMQNRRAHSPANSFASAATSALVCVRLVLCLSAWLWSLANAIHSLFHQLGLWAIKNAEPASSDYP